MKNIIITNDDGIYAPGLKPLIKELKEIANIITIVPNQERSAASHSITLHKPLRVDKIWPGIYIANGTPADCVRFGVISLAKRKIDLVVSGINSGPNLGQDVIYSGTVAGAREAALLDIPSFAISITDIKNPNFNLAAKISKKIAQIILNKKRDFPPRVYLNVNVPSKILGIKITTLGLKLYDEEIECRIDPRGKKYYWIGGKISSLNKQPGTDINAVESNFVSITPLQIDPTAERYINFFNQWIEALD